MEERRVSFRQACFWLWPGANVFLSWGWKTPQDKGTAKVLVCFYQLERDLICCANLFIGCIWTQNGFHFHTTTWLMTLFSPMFSRRLRYTWCNLAPRPVANLFMCTGLRTLIRCRWSFLKLGMLTRTLCTWSKKQEATKIGFTLLCLDWLRFETTSCRTASMRVWWEGTRCWCLSMCLLRPLLALICFIGVRICWRKVRQSCC